MLRVAATSLSGSVEDGSQPASPVEERSYGDGLTLEEAVRVVLSRPEFRRIRTVRVVLASPGVQLRTLHGLPPLDEADLERFVRQGARRFFRLGEGPMVMSAAWMAPVGAGRARAAAAPEGWVSRLEAAVRDAGHERVHLVVEQDDQYPELELETSAHRDRRLRRQLRSLLLLPLLAVTSWAAAGGVYLLDLLRDRRALLAEATAVEALVPRVEAIREELVAFRMVARAVNANAAESSWTVAALEDLTAAVPDGCHLQRVSLSRPESSAVIDASCADPEVLLRELRDHGFSRVALESSPAPGGGGSSIPLTVRLELFS